MKLERMNPAPKCNMAWLCGNCNKMVRADNIMVDMDAEPFCRNSYICEDCIIDITNNAPPDGIIHL